MYERETGTGLNGLALSRCGGYRCVVTNSAGSATSNVARLDIVPFAGPKTAARNWML